MGQGDSELIDQLGAAGAGPSAGPGPTPPLPSLPPAGQIPGALFEGLMNALNLPRRAVQTGLFGGEEQAHERFRGALENPLARMIPGTQILGALGPSAQNVAADVGMDPLSAVGLGGPAKLLELASARNMSPAVIAALTALSRGEQGVQRGLQLPFELAAGAAKLPAKIPGTSLGRKVLEEDVTGGITERASTSLYDYLTSTSRESMLKLFGRRLVDANNALKAEGVDLMDYVRSVRRKTPGYEDPAKAGTILMEMETTLADNLDHVADPRAKVAGLDVVAEAHRMVGRAWEQALMPVQDAYEKGVAPRILTRMAAKADQEGFDRSVQIYMAAQDTIGQLGSQAKELAPFGGGATAKGALDQVTTGVRSAQSYFTNQLDRFYQGLPNSDPFVYTQALVQRGDKFTKEIGNLTERLRVALQVADPHAGQTPMQQTVIQQLAQRADQLKQQGRYVPGIVADLPSEDLRRIMTTQYGNIEGKLNQIIRARNTLESVTKDVWEKSPLTQGPMPPVNQDDPLEWLNQTLTQAGAIDAPIQGVHELLERVSLAGRTGEDKIKRLRDAVNSFPGGDILTGDPFEMVIDRVIRERAGTLGLTDPNKLQSILGDVTAFYKNQALLSGSYPIQNLAGGLLGGGLKGVNPMRVMRGLMSNLDAINKGEKVQTNAAKNFAEDYGQGFGDAVHQASGLLEVSDLRDYLRRGISSAERIGSVKLAGTGAALGGFAGAMQAPSDATPEERLGSTLTGAATYSAGGAVMPFVSRKLLQQLGGGLETVMRETAAVQGATQFMAKNGERLRQIAADAVGSPEIGLQASAKGLVSRRVRRDYDPGNVQTVMDEVGNRIAEGAKMRPDELENILRVAGVDTAKARAAGRQWAEVVHEGVKAGEDFANMIHFDYQNLTNMEQFLKAFVPFSTWAAKAIPFYVEEMAQHPVILSSLLNINAESERAMKERGVTSRFAGAIPIDFASAIFSALIGRKAEAWFDPTRGLLPFSGAARQFGVGSEDDPLIKQGLNKLTALGPGPHPLIEEGLRLSGILGKDEPARGYLRWGQPIQGALAALGVNRGRGIDVNAPGMAGEEMVRRAGGQDPTNIRDSLAARRLDELALEKTGKNIGSGDPAVGEFAKAKAEKSGPLWDQAMREVSRERGVQSMVGFASQSLSPQALLGETEANIRETQKGRIVPKDLSDQVRRYAEKDPTALAPPELVAHVREAAQEISDQRTGGKIPESVEMILTSAPTMKNLSRILGMITEAQAIDQPAMMGYQGGGGGQEQQLRSYLAEYENLGALNTDKSPEQVQSLSNLAQTYEHPALRASGANAIILQGLQRQRDAFRKSHPILDQYLSYQAEKKGQGNFEDFFQNHYGKG